MFPLAPSGWALFAAACAPAGVHAISSTMAATTVRASPPPAGRLTRKTSLLFLLCTSFSQKTASPNFHEALLARLCDHVDQRRFSVLDDLDGPLNRRPQILRVRNRPLGMHAHTLRQLGEVDFRVDQGGTDIGTVDATIVTIGHTLHVHQLLMISAIVVHDTEQRNLVMRRCPQNSRSIHQIAIALNSDCQAPVLLVGQRRAERCRSAIADAVTSCSSDRLVVLVKRPQPHWPVADPG